MTHGKAQELPAVECNCKYLLWHIIATLEKARLNLGKRSRPFMTFYLVSGLGNQLIRVLIGFLIWTLENSAYLESLSL